MFSSRKKKRDRKKKLKSSSFSWVFRYFEQPLGGADPALVGGCVLPVLSFNTNEEELVMGGLVEKSTVSRQQRTSTRGSVKTSAFEELERGGLSARLCPGSVLCDKSWQTSLWRHATNRNLLTLPKLDVQMECSRLSLSRPGREDWSLGSEVTAVGFLKATFCGCGEACLRIQKTVRQFDSRLLQSQCTVEIQGGGFSVASFMRFF